MSAFVKFKDIEGESTDSGHDKWIIFESVSSSIHRSIPSGAKDQQRFKGETSLGDIQLVRQLDKSSPKIQEACANGTPFGEVEIHLCATVKNKEEPYLKYKLKNVIISSYSFHGDSSGDPLPSEQVSLSYTEVEWTYVVINPETGDKSGDVAAKYNLGKNQA